MAPSQSMKGITPMMTNYLCSYFVPDSQFARFFRCSADSKAGVVAQLFATEPRAELIVVWEVA